MQETRVRFLGREDPWRRGRLPSPVYWGFPGGSDGKESGCNAGDLGSIPGSGRAPWRREWQPTPVFWPRESHGQSLVGYSPWSRKEWDMTERLNMHALSNCSPALQCSCTAVLASKPSFMPPGSYPECLSFPIPLGPWREGHLLTMTHRKCHQCQ